MIDDHLIEDIARIVELSKLRPENQTKPPAVSEQDTAIVKEQSIDLSIKMNPRKNIVFDDDLIDDIMRMVELSKLRGNTVVGDGDDDDDMKPLK
jgi:hypothetical protein